MVDHLVGEIGTALCGGPQREKDESTAKFNERLKEYRDAKAEFGKEREKKRSTKASVELFTGGNKKQRNEVMNSNQNRIEEFGFSSSGVNTFADKEVTERLVRGVISAGIAPNVLENVLFQNALLYIKKASQKWVPPGADAFYKTCLEEEHKKVKEKMAKERNKNMRRGVILVGDGATNVKRQPVMNVIAVRGNTKEFIEALDCRGQTKDARFICKQFTRVMENLYPGCQKTVTGIFQDNATRKSWELIEEKHPWIVAGACQPHVLDLLLEDVGKLPLCTSTMDDVHKVRGFLRRYEKVSHIFSTLQVSAIRRPGDTRFAMNCISMSDVWTNKAAIMSTFNSSELHEFMLVSKNQKGKDGQSVKISHDQCKAIIFENSFWDKLRWALKAMEPIEKLLRFAEIDGPTLSKMHARWVEMIEDLGRLEEEGADQGFVDDVLERAYYRFEYGYNILMAAGYILDPQFIDCPVSDDDNQALIVYVRKYFGSSEPGEDPVSEESLTVIEHQFRIELSQYRNKEGLFGSNTYMYAIEEVKAGKMSACDYWEVYGDHAKLLQEIAIRACACVCGASAAERGHKEMAFVLTKVRNRMSHRHMEQLVYCRMNYAAETQRSRGSMTLPAASHDNAAEEAESESDEDSLRPMDVAWLDPRGAMHEEETIRGKTAAIARGKRRAEAAAKGRARISKQLMLMERARAAARSAASLEAQGTDGQLTGRRATITKLGTTARAMKELHEVTILKEMSPGTYNVVFEATNTVAFVNLSDKGCVLIETNEDEEED